MSSSVSSLTLSLVITTGCLGGFFFSSLRTGGGSSFSSRLLIFSHFLISVYFLTIYGFVYWRLCLCSLRSVNLGLIFGCVSDWMETDDTVRDVLRAGGRIVV